MTLPGLQVNFQPMTISDLPGVMAIENDNYGFPWSDRVFRDCLLSRQQCWLMRAEHRLVGYSVLSIKAGLAHLLNLSIKKDYQSRGLGRCFLQFMLNRARNLKAQEVYLEVRVSNFLAHHLYISEGFNEVGQSKGYYPAKKAREDAVVLAFNL